MDRGPGYTIADLVFYSGLFAGIIVTYLSLNAAEVELHQIVKLLIGLAIGCGVGWVCLKIYEASRKPPPDGRQPPTNSDDFFRR
jgi:hypothetical protein